MMDAYFDQKPKTKCHYNDIKKRISANPGLCAVLCNLL